jgi:AcrR family transcriptional regulator
MTTTKGRILAAGKKEFAANGYGGGRIERIAKAARVNLRMIYHYFGDKDGLYLSVMESVYQEVREKEGLLHLDDREPEEGMRMLVEFTFDHFLRHPEFVDLLTSENMRKAETIRKSKVVPALAVPIMEIITKLVRKGIRQNKFRKGIDPVQLFVTLHAVCYLHVSNRHTMSAMLKFDLGDKKWLAERRRHITDVIIRYLRK